MSLRHTASSCLFSAFFFSFFFSEQSLVSMNACSGRVRDHLQRFDVLFYFIILFYFGCVGSSFLC